MEPAISKQNSKNVRKHPFVILLEQELRKDDFSFHSLGYYNREVIFFSTENDGLIKFVEVMYQPVKPLSYFSIFVGVKSYHMRDDYNVIRPWECIDESMISVYEKYPLEEPVTVVKRNLCFVRNYLRPDLEKKLDYGREDIELDLQVKDFINDFQAHGKVFLNNVSTNSQLIDFLENIENYTLPSERGSVCWRDRDFVLMFLKSREGDILGALRSLDIWFSNKRATIERNFASAELQERKNSILTSITCEYHNYKKFLGEFSE